MKLTVGFIIRFVASVLVATFFALSATESNAQGTNVPAAPSDGELLQMLRSGDVGKENDALKHLSRRVQRRPGISCGPPRVDVWPVSREIGLEILRIGRGRQELLGDILLPAGAAIATTPELFDFIQGRINEIMERPTGRFFILEDLGGIALAISPRVDEAVPMFLRLLDTGRVKGAVWPLAADGERARQGLQERVRAEKFTRLSLHYGEAVLSALAGVRPDSETVQFLWEAQKSKEWEPLRSCANAVLARAKWPPLFAALVEDLKAGGIGERSIETLNDPMAKKLLADVPQGSVARSMLLGPNAVNLLPYYDQAGWEVLTKLLSSNNAVVVTEAAVELGFLGPVVRPMAETALKSACERTGKTEICVGYRRVIGEAPTPYPWDPKGAVVVVRQ